MGRLATLALFVLVLVAVFLAFAPLGGALGEAGYGAYEAMTAGGTQPVTAALVVLLGIDLLATLIALGVSYAGGVRLPSGLPQVFFTILVPLTLATTQVRFFELAGNLDGFADSFGGYNFIGMFILSVLASQAGVSLSRRHHERVGVREAANTRG